GQVAKGRAHLTTLLAEARKLNHVPNEMDIRLAMLDVEVRGGNVRAAAEIRRTLQHDAAERGFGLVAAQASQLGGLTVAAGRGRGETFTAPYAGRSGGPGDCCG